MPSNVPLTGPIVQYPNGAYNTHFASNGQGGCRAVADKAARNALPAWAQQLGMVVVLQSDDSAWLQTTYPLTGVDADWAAFAGSSGTITLSGDASGSGTTSIAVSVDDWHGTPFATMAIQAASAVAITGGAITGMPTPTNGSDVATKSYVDGLTTGFTPKDSCVAASTANLTATYANGSSGVGATLTNSSTQAAFTIDGVSFAGGERVLVKDQTTQANNGIYAITTLGSGATNWVLTRATDFDQGVTVAAGEYTVVSSGTAGAGTVWVQTHVGPFTIGTTPIVFSKVGVASITITLAGDTTGTGTGSIATTTAKVHGVSYPAGPATNTVPVVTSANTVTYEAVPNAALANSSVTVTAGTGLSGGGTVGLGGSVTINLVTPVPVSSGGTGHATLTPYAVLCGGATSTGAVQSVASVGTAGQVLTSNGAGVLPTWQAGGGGGGGVTRVNTGTGLTGGPITTTGTVSMAAGTANSLAGYNGSGVFAGVSIGAGLGLSGGVLHSTSSGGTVTLINTGAGLTGGPITGSGTISLKGGLVTVADPVSRDAIPSARRIEGMIAYIEASSGTAPATYWQLGPAPWAFDDTDWVLAGPLRVNLAGTLVGQRGTLNLIQGSGATLTVADNPTTDAVDVTIAASGGSGTVTSVATGTGLTGGPITGTGTVSIAAGGVGTTQLAAAGVTYAKVQNVAASRLLGNPTGSAASPSEITLGSGLSFSGTTLVAAGSGGTATSVALSLPSSILTVSGSPVTTSGTLTGTLATQSANLLWAGPTTGSAAAPTFRAMVTADLPTGIPNANLANSSVTISGHSLSLGGSLALAAADVSLGSVTNDAQTKAAIVPNTAPSAGQVLVGNAGGTAYAPVSMSGDGTLSSAGALAVTKIGGTAVSLPISAANGGTGGATLTAHAVLLGEGTSAVAFATVGTAGRPLVDQGSGADPAFASTGVKIDSHFGAIGTVTASAGAAAVNLVTNEWWDVTLSHSATTTLSLTSPTVGQQFTLTLIQDGTGSNLVTWFSGIKWPNGAVPTLSTAANAIDVFTFKCKSAGVYHGFTPGLAMA